MDMMVQTVVSWASKLVACFDTMLAYMKFQSITFHPQCA
jgi:hypothetical protein